MMNLVQTCIPAFPVSLGIVCILAEVKSFAPTLLGAYEL